MNIISRLWELMVDPTFVAEQQREHTSPYRTAAVIPQEPQIKPKKKAFKMDLKLGKHTKTFGYIVPVCVSFVGMGLLYDAPILGQGIKWGASCALGVIVIFFAMMAIGHADKESE